MDSVKYWPRLRRATNSVFLPLFTTALTAGAAWPQTDSEDAPEVAAQTLLEQFVAEVDDLSARFEQSVYDADGELTGESSAGTFALLRPDRFRWDYATPFEYQVVADGEYLWEYDVDLEQATRAPLSELATSPAMLLSGEGTVGDNYDVRDMPSADGERWIELVPIEGESDFMSIEIAFRDGLPRALELVDGLGQTTRIAFEDIRINSGLEAKAFEFDPPRGVNVVGADD
jgi:outer membrane lipoprotein carrier protein